MNAHFMRALSFVLRPDIEGGYSNDPADPGGVTNYGVTQVTLDFARRSMPGLPASVVSLTFDQVSTIYHELYWVPAHCDALPAGVDLFTFDSAVQHDPNDAVRFVQLGLGALIPDGDFGARTLAKVRATSLWKPVLRSMAAHRMFHYMMLGETQRKRFGHGWANRLFHCYDVAKEIVT